MNHRVSRRTALIALGVALPTSAHAESLSDLLGQTLGTQSGKSGGAARLGALGFSSAEADSALRQALTLGAGRVAAKLGAADGYFADPKVHIPLPKTLANAKSTLSAIGMSKPLDDLELKLNRGAEAAAPKAKTLFVNAIKAMTVEDAVGIVRGGDTAGTDYLKGKTLPSLTAAFTPPMKSALTSVGALKAADKASTSMAQFGYQKDLRGELISYAVGKALDGMFLYLGDEERAIRKDPVNRTTAILKKVFGAI